MWLIVSGTRGLSLEGAPDIMELHDEITTKKKKRISHVLHGAEKGGPDELALTLYRNLKKRYGDKRLLGYTAYPAPEEHFDNARDDLGPIFHRNKMMAMITGTCDIFDGGYCLIFWDGKSHDAANLIKEAATYNLDGQVFMQRGDKWKRLNMMAASLLAEQALKTRG